MKHSPDELINLLTQFATDYKEDLSRIDQTGWPNPDITLGAHHAEGLVNPKVRAQTKVTDLGYPRACRFRKYQIVNRSPELTGPTFFNYIPAKLGCTY
jgi:hypothetical protein